MSLQSFFKTIARVKDSVLRKAKHDKLNVAEKVRGPQASEMILRNKKNFDKVIRTDVDVQQEPDLEMAASLISGSLTFTSVAKGPQGNLLVVEIKDGAALSIKTKKNEYAWYVQIVIDSGTTTNQELKDALDASKASNLVSVEIASGDEADPAALLEDGQLKGGA